MVVPRAQTGNPISLAVTVIGVGWRADRATASTRAEVPTATLQRLNFEVTTRAGDLDRV